jgi:hypothetical protein
MKLFICSQGQLVLGDCLKPRIYRYRCEVTIKAIGTVPRASNYDDIVLGLAKTFERLRIGCLAAPLGKLFLAGSSCATASSDLEVQVLSQASQTLHQQTQCLFAGRLETSSSVLN